MVDKVRDKVGDKVGEINMYMCWVGLVLYKGVMELYMYYIYCVM